MAKKSRPSKSKNAPTRAGRRRPTRRAQWSLRASEKRHREIVETANEGICITNDDDQIVFANRRLGAMLGMPAEALVGRSLRELTDDEHKSAPLQRPFPSPVSEERLRRADGTTFHVSVSESVMRDDNGRVTGRLRMYTDATSRHELFKARELLVRQLVAVQERERERIARELHDQLGQHIVGLSLGLARLAALSDERNAQLIEQLRTVANSLARDMHTLAFELRPSALDHLGLAAALRGYGDELAARTDLHVDMHCDHLDDLRLDSALETGVYRIAQEALTNVVKHAGARTVSVILEKHAGALQLIVEDDGLGFDVNDRQGTPNKLGLAGMRERAALLGGVLNIESSSGQGTTVYARIPLHPSKNNDDEQETSAVAG